MAMPTFQAAGTVSETAVAATNIQPAWPAHVAGDVALLILESGEYQGVGTAHCYFVDDAGFQEIRGASPCYGGQVSGSGAVPGASGANARNLRAFWCRATSSAMSGPIIGGGPNHKSAIIITFRGCAATGNPIHKAAANRYQEATATAQTFPAVTTTDANCLIVNIAGGGDDNRYSGWANASLAAPAITEAVDRGNDTLGTGTGLGVAYGGLAAAGASGSTTVNISFADFLAMITLALTGIAPAADATPFIANIGDIIQSNTGNITVPWPPHKTGDVGILCVFSSTFPIAALPTPAGFTEIANTRQSAGSSGVDFNGTACVAYSCTATSSSMASPVVPWGGQFVRAFIFTVRNSGGVGAAAGTSQGVASTNYSIAGPTTLKDHALVAILASNTRGVAAPTSNADWANANLVDLTPDIIDSGDGTIHQGINMGWGTKVLAGAVGNTTWTEPNASRYVGMAISFKPTSNALVADIGHFTMGGKAAGLLRHLSLPAAKGAFVMGGKASTLSAIFHHYTLAADTGHFKTTPHDAKLTHDIGGGWSRELENPANDWVKQPPLES